MSTSPTEDSPPRFSRLAPDARRDEILAAARTVVVEQGFSGASTSAVAERAGVTRGLVHHYFGNKRDLFLAVLADLTASVPAAVRTDLPEMPLDELVESNAVAFLDAFGHNREVWRALLGAEGIGDPEVTELMDGMRDRIVERMAVNWAEGREPTEELRLVLRVFVGAGETVATEWALRGRATRDQAEALLLGTLRAMVRDVLPGVPAAT
jgi:AcrR family transcriptional regulator